MSSLRSTMEHTLGFLRWAVAGRHQLARCGLFVSPRHLRCLQKHSHGTADSGWCPAHSELACSHQPPKHGCLQPDSAPVRRPWEHMLAGVQGKTRDRMHEAELGRARLPAWHHSQGSSPALISALPPGRPHYITDNARTMKATADQGPCTCRALSAARHNLEDDGDESKVSAPVTPSCPRPETSLDWSYDARCADVDQGAMPLPAGHCPSPRRVPSGPNASAALAGPWRGRADLPPVMPAHVCGAGTGQPWLRQQRSFKP